MPRLVILIAICFSAGVFASTANAQCRTMDKTVHKPLVLVKGSAIVRDTIRLCTSHVFSFRGVRGRQLKIKLTTGNKTSMTILPPSGETLIDGDLSWNGRLTETGEYEVQIGTDATARYTLEISIK